jgi:hypothetical protein
MSIPNPDADDSPSLPVVAAPASKPKPKNPSPVVATSKIKNPNPATPILSEFEAPVVPPALGKEQAHAILDEAGYELVLETIAMGTPPATLAAHYGTSVLTFKSWLALCPNPELVGEATKACADSLVAKATAVLALPAKNSADAAKAKNYAELLVQIAERLNPEAWTPPRKFEAPPPAVNIIIGDSRSLKTDTGEVIEAIPGLDALRVKS